MSFSFSSFFAGVDAVAHTFLGYIGKTLGVIGKYEPAIADGLAHSMAYIEPLVTDVVAAEYGGPAGVLVDAGLKNILTSANALKSLIYDWQNSPGIIAKFEALAGDVASIVALGHIKNQASIDKLNRIAQEAAAAAAVGLKALTPPTPAA
jgi:hypothetical protein